LRWLRAFISGGLRLYSDASNYGEIQSGGLSASRTYTLPDSSGTLIVKDGAKIVHDIAAIGFANGGFESTFEIAGLSANRTITVPDDSGTAILDNSVQDISNKTFAPDGTSSGQAGTVRLKELAANGAEYVGIRAADSIGASYHMTLPSVQGGAGTTLSNDGTGVLTWQAPNSTFGPIGVNAGDGGRIQLQELAANGTHVVRIKSPDAIAVSFDLTMPAALPAVAGAGLSFNTAGIASFTASPMATRQTADESAFIFSLLSIGV
jgi:hypothetical protein